MPIFRLFGGRFVMSAPSSVICPAVGTSKPAIMRSVVVFPQAEEGRERGPGQEERDRELAEDDRQGEEGAAENGHPNVRQDDLRENRRPPGAEALGGLRQGSDVDG